MEKLYKVKKALSLNHHKVKNKNVILVYDYDKNGELNFSVAEILDAQKGIYIVLKNGQIVISEPFAGESNTDIEIKAYSEHGGETTSFTQKADYNQLPRTDNVVYSVLYHFLSSKTNKVFGVVDNFHHVTDNKHFYASNNLVFENYGTLKKPFTAQYFDKMGLFKLTTSNVDKWLEFEREFNKIFKHFVHTGKNYLKEEEWKVVKENAKHQEELDETRKRIHETFCNEK